MDSIMFRSSARNITLIKRFKLKTSLLQIVILLSLSTIRSQIISHEIRRLAAATNQFGIDSLRALDRIEPPDKVLVFCPVCISSTLTMIMMGSSKLQVVSSLRHALYVWSMKPQEINRAFKDIFQHIGLNQNLKVPRSQATTLLPLESGRIYSHVPAMNNSQPYRKIGEQHPTRRSLIVQPNRYSHSYATLSLPNLIKFKDALDGSASQTKPWWHSLGKQNDAYSSIDPMGTDYSYKLDDYDRGSKMIASEDPIDMSQMSAMCNIYLQRGLTMNLNYNLLLRQYYDTVIHPVDFIKNTEETRNHINSLVAANTENKIKDLVKRGQFETETAPKIMMISTFHFRGTLDIEMKASKKSIISDVSNIMKPKQRKARSYKRRARRDTIQVKSKKSQYIETETSLLKYGHFTGLGCSVIEIPFSNRLVTLVVVMPDHLNTTDLLLTRLSAQVLNDMINSLVVKRLSLEIPVIKFDRGPINSEGLLRELGLDNLFFGNQTFSTETGLNRWMRGSDILHETSIDIGTLNPNWGLPEDRLKVGAHDSRSIEANHVRLDKPFFYFVMDSMNSLILTMGRIRQ